MSDFYINVDGLAEKFTNDFDAVKRNTKCPNILILGQTGVGKSSLINYIFGKKLAEVSDVKSETKGFHYYKNEGTPVTIIDSEGYELNKSDVFVHELEAFVNDAYKDTNKQVHLAWYCINAGSARIFTYDIENIKTLLHLNVPVAVVLTKCDLDDPEASKAKGITDEVKRAFGGIIKVFQTSNDKEVNKDLDIENLLSWSIENISDENLKRGFIIAQKCILEYKEKAAKGRVKYYVAVAAGIGGAPIPMSDAVALTALQLRMTADIFNIFGIDNSFANLTKNFIQAKITSIIGKLIAGNLIKMIPGIGQVGGAVINATVAATITSSMGYGICILARMAIENAWEGNELVENLFSKENLDKAFKQGAAESTKMSQDE